MNYKQVSSTVDIFRHCSELLQRKDATLHLTLPAEYEAFVDKVASHPHSKKKYAAMRMKIHFDNVLRSLSQL